MRVVKKSTHNRVIIGLDNLTRLNRFVLKKNVLSIHRKVRLQIK